LCFLEEILCGSCFLFLVFFSRQWLTAIAHKVSGFL
jgi:hypothetical protein